MEGKIVSRGKCKWCGSRVIRASVWVGQAKPFLKTCQFGSEADLASGDEHVCRKDAELRSSRGYPTYCYRCHADKLHWELVGGKPILRDYLGRDHRCMSKNTVAEMDPMPGEAILRGFPKE